MKSTGQSCIKIIFYRPHTSCLSSPCLNLNFIGYVWSDKSPVEFTRWNPQQPDSHHGQQPCVEMYSTGEWGDTGCYSVKQFICKMPRCKLSPGRVYCITAVTNNLELKNKKSAADIIVGFWRLLVILK